MRRPRSLHILSFFALIFPALLLAQEPPQYAVLPDGVTAMRATELIRNGQTIRLFCEPCGDRYVQEIRVVSVSAEEHPEEEDPRWVLRINRAYYPVEEIYLRREREWRNLAHLLGFDPADVPETIYPFLRARPIPPQE